MRSVIQGSQAVSFNSVRLAFTAPVRIRSIKSVDDPRVLDGFIVGFESDDRREREEMHTAQVVVGVGRGESVEMGAADGGEQEGVRLGGNDPLEAGWEAHD